MGHRHNIAQGGSAFNREDTSRGGAALLTILLLVLRTHPEDRTLQAELPSCREYAAEVPYRLIPGIW